MNIYKNCIGLIDM